MAAPNIYIIIYLSYFKFLNKKESINRKLSIFLFFYTKLCEENTLNIHYRAETCIEDLL